MKSKPTIRRALPLFIGGLALSGLAHGQVSITTADGNGADGSLQNDSNRASNFVDSGSIKTRYFPGVRMKVGYLRFDISGLAATSDNSEATLSITHVYQNARTRPWVVYGLRDGTPGELLAENTICYDNAPGIIDSDEDATNGKGNEDAVDILTTLDIYDATTNPTGVWELVGNAEFATSIGNPTTMTGLDLGSFIDADTDGIVTFLVIPQGGDNIFDLASHRTGATSADYPTLVLPNATAGDSDSDGLPDSWEIANFILPTEDPVADAATIIARQSGTDDSDTDTGLAGGTSDPDGFDNATEFAAGSDPLNKLSVPSDIDADGLADLWEDQHFGDNSGTVELSDLTPQDGSGDPDADWGTNEEEETAATDPNDRASFLDEEAAPDLQNDWWEIAYFGDTSTSTSPSDDIDSDSSDNAAEYAAYSNPNETISVPGDIDGDGVPDLWEDRYYGNNDGIVTDVEAAADLDGTDGTLDNEPDGFTDLEESNALVPSDPFNANSVPDNADGDTLSDAWELTYFADIYGQNGLNDSDNDLYTNEEEEVGATDPTDNLDYIDDVDADGINDRWELKYFLTLDAGAGGTDDFFEDSDSDSFSNDEEYDALSNPNNMASTPDDIDGDGLGDTFEITFFGDIYTYTGSDDPDRDYSTNSEEEIALTDPNNRAISPDTDFDGLGDGWEMFSFGNLTTTDAPLDDNDTDGHDNATEYAAATNGNDPISTPDTDGDSLPDGWEIFYFILSGEDPIADSATIIARQSGADDSDSDGASNRLELLSGTNPNDINDVPNPARVSTALGNGADTFLTNDGNTGPNVVHGAENGMALRVFEGVRIRVPVIRFDVSGLGGDLTNTLLQLNMTGAPRTRDIFVYGLVDGDSGENWDEATTIYPNAPGIIPADANILNTFARDPQRLRLLGTLQFIQGQSGIYLSDPNRLDLKSFLEADTDGLVTIMLSNGDENHEWYLTTKEGDANLAPALVSPLGTVTTPSSPKITAVSFDTAGNTFTMSTTGLGIGQQYHVESSTTGTFAAVAGSTFTATTDPQDVVVTADEATTPTQLFRISDGAEP